jgi:hypothetical protein
MNFNDFDEAGRAGFNAREAADNAKPYEPKGNGTKAKTCEPSKWREKYKVHPAADVFPMMSDDELQKLGEDIEKHGLKHPLTFFKSGDDESVLVDGRNRLTAMERVGIRIDSFPIEKRYYTTGDPVAHIIGLNIHRRHLTKQQQADLIVAAHKAAAAKPRQVDEVFEEQLDLEDAIERKRRAEGSKGGRGKVNEVKAAAVATAKEHGISKSTVERALAKAEGRQPAPIAKLQLGTKPKLEATGSTGLDAARRRYLEEFVRLTSAEREAEWRILFGEIKALPAKGGTS